MPTVTIAEGAPVTYNDPAFAERLRAAATAVLGKDRVLDAHAVMGSEDVSLFSLDGQIPFAFYWLGAADPAKLAESRKTGVPLPSLHSALFAPASRRNSSQSIALASRSSFRRGRMPATR
jgi:hippurate hydrolase